MKQSHPPQQPHHQYHHQSKYNQHISSSHRQTTSTSQLSSSSRLNSTSREVGSGFIDLGCEIGHLHQHNFLRTENHNQHRQGAGSRTLSSIAGALELDLSRSLDSKSVSSFENRPSSSVPKSIDSQSAQSSSMAYQHKHALHRLRRLKKRSPHRDLVISFVPRLRTSIINRLDFFYRYSKQEQEVLSCFDFLDELVSNYCDGGQLQDSPRSSIKLYQSMIYEYI